MFIQEDWNTEDWNKAKLPYFSGEKFTQMDPAIQIAAFLAQTLYRHWQTDSTGIVQLLDGMFRISIKKI